MLWAFEIWSWIFQGGNHEVFDPANSKGGGDGIFYKQYFFPQYRKFQQLVTSISYKMALIGKLRSTKTVCEWMVFPKSDQSSHTKFSAILRLELFSQVIRHQFWVTWFLSKSKIFEHHRVRAIFLKLADDADLDAVSFKVSNSKTFKLSKKKRIADTSCYTSLTN